jgi:hypothetical protein
MGIKLNPQICCVSRMQDCVMMNHVVHIVTTVFWTSKGKGKAFPLHPGQALGVPAG